MTYTITLTATNSEGTDTATYTLTDLNEEILSHSAVSTTVSKGINDLMWLCQIEYDGHPAIDSSDITVYMKDHTDTDQLVFMGYIPNPAYRTQEGGNKTTVTAYSYFWYLTKQYLPVLESDGTGPRNTLFCNDTTAAVTPTVDIYNLRPGMTTVEIEESVYINIKKYVEYLLGGISSTTINGLTIHEVVDCDDWNDGTIKNKGFDFVREDITVMDAIQVIKEYLSYYFMEVFYNSSTDLDYAIFVPDSATDDQLHVPEKVTFTWPDAYVVGPVYGDNKLGEMCNRVRVRCSPGILTKTFTSTSSPDTFTLYVANPGRADSCTVSVQHGSTGYIDDNAPAYTGVTYYAGDMVTYSGVVYECILSCSGRTPDVNPTYWQVYELPEVTEHLSGGAVDWVTCNNLHYTPTHAHADIVTVTYLPDVDYYEQSIQTAAVTAGTEKPIDAPPVYDTDGSLGLTTQDEVDEYCNALWELYRTDSSIYHATLLKRTDLRLMQLVKFVGYDKIPEDDMRITHITYRKGPNGIFVDIQCTLDKILTLNQILKESTTISDVNLIERIIDKKIKQTNNEKTMKAWVAKVQGDVATVKTDAGVFVEKENV